MDLGSPASYLTLAEGTPVYSSDGRELGRVEHLLADPEIDIFDGIVVRRRGPKGGHRFIDADQVDEIFERGVLLELSYEEAVSVLPNPGLNPAAMGVNPGDDEAGELQRKLRRAWDLISGRAGRG
jgi:uncharacterized protein YrrD